MADKIIAPENLKEILFSQDEKIIKVSNEVSL